MRDWFPALVAIRGEERRYGWDTWSVLTDPEWTVIRSLKRELKDAGPRTELDVGGHSVRITDLLRGLAQALRRNLLEASTLRVKPGDEMEVMLGVPANANSNQRFLTTEAFRAAGFRVIGLLNEPSAASVEFAHVDRAPTKRGLLVYDLGGGTFDASLVMTEGGLHTVLATAGIPTLGGDDFDEILAGLALEAAGDADELTPAEVFRLLDECREKKESLNPNTRKLVIDLDRVRAGWGEVTVAAADFYEHCRPLIEQTRETVDQLIGACGAQSIDTLYVTGGGAELPAVARVLKEHFGRKVRRSAYMRSATAIGLAISGDPRSGYRVKDRLTHHFGVWREANVGREVAFDLLVPGGTVLPGPSDPPYRITRSYHPAHNVGHFRYVECSQLGETGQPSGDITVWEDVRFPFDPSLFSVDDLAEVPVIRADREHEQYVTEEYACDASGRIQVRIANVTAGYSREYHLGNWTVPRSRTTRKARSPIARRRQS